MTLPVPDSNSIEVIQAQMESLLAQAANLMLQSTDPEHLQDLGLTEREWRGRSLDLITPAELVWNAVQVGNRDVVGHDGSDNGVTTRMVFDPKTKIGALILMNVEENQDIESASDKLIELLLKAGEQFI